jgi:sigma-B regulation protein RsbU (phosphoserine phosphatase)
VGELVCENSGFVAGSNRNDGNTALGWAYRYFILGDVSGKGLAAFMLMSHLQATMRILLRNVSSLEQIVAETSRTFRQTSLPAQFATLALGRTTSCGEVRLINAGHLPAARTHQDSVETRPSTDVPLGLFCETEFVTKCLKASLGETLFLDSDRVSETEERDQSFRRHGRRAAGGLSCA